MNEDFEEHDDVQRLVSEFEEMIRKKGHRFFEEEELEEIIDYYFNLSQLKLAQKALDFADTLYPCSTAFLMKKATLALMSGDTAAASVWIEKAENIEPNNPDIYLLKAEWAAQENRYDDMEKMCERALQLSDNENDIYFGIAVIYINAMRFDKAAAIFEKILKTEPDNAQAIYELANCYQESGKLNEAIRWFNRYLDLEPYSSFAWFNLGLAYTSKGQHTKAIEAYDFAVTIDEHFSSAYFNRASAQYEQENYKAALEDFKKVIELEGDEVSTLCRMGDCYFSLEHYTEAARYYRKAESINQHQSGEPWFGLGLIAELFNSDKEAEFCFRKAHQNETSNSTYLLALGNLKYDQDDYEQALKFYKKALHLEPDHEQCRVMLAHCLYQLKQLPKAIETLMEGYKAEPDNAEFLYPLEIGRAHV